MTIADWEELNAVIEEFFSATVENINGEWIAIDGKVLRGTITDNDNETWYVKVSKTVATAAVLKLLIRSDSSVDHPKIMSI
ncbi:hypothetical protein DRO03_10525 [Methanosarcinales archaeon]|nr:MAG: hypothetical protein DRO03_10525 [Methanosarcinales archaeon]